MDEVLIICPCPYCKQQPTIRTFQNGFIQIACEYYGCNGPVAIGGLTIENAVAGWNNYAEKYEGEK